MNSNQHQSLNGTSQEAPNLLPVAKTTPTNPLPWLIRNLIRKRDGDQNNSDDGVGPAKPMSG